MRTNVYNCISTYYDVNWLTELIKEAGTNDWMVDENSVDPKTGAQKDIKYMYQELISRDVAVAFTEEPLFKTALLDQSLHF